MLTTSQHKLSYSLTNISLIKTNTMGKYNRCRNAKKENDFIVLERDIKYAKDVPPQVAELVEAGV